MSSFDLKVMQWLAGAGPEQSVEDATLASLMITAGRHHLAVTEVEDTIARTVRSHINVSAYPLASWLLANWWRLRWEPEHKRQPDWLETHSMAAVSPDYAWPALRFASDGEFIQLTLAAEPIADVAGVRYLRAINIDIPATEFETAIDSFVDLVVSRLGAILPAQRDLEELRAEIADERATPDRAHKCKLEALAGLDPGCSGNGWLDSAQRIATTAGRSAGEEVIAVVPDLNGMGEAEVALAAIRAATATVDLTGVPAAGPRVADEVPWKRGARLAASLRSSLQVTTDALSDSTLETLLGIKLPLARGVTPHGRVLSGAYRNGAGPEHASLLVPMERLVHQRFYLARVIAAAMVSQDGEHLLPVSRATTALQKVERAFAQELLCPWGLLEPMIEELGTGDEAIEEAAEHFQVSEQVVLTTLVNKRFADRDRLPTA